MEKELFSPMAIDALGEMMNISLGSSATAVSNMLDHRVDITTPRVSVVEVKDFTIGNLDPAMGVEIKYVEGLEGSNIMLLKKSDIKVIVDILMGTEMPEEEFELNELTISAVCELMNQMMGAAATALSDFLGFPVNISTPQPFELEDLENFKEQHLPQGANVVVVVRFSLKIENALESEFMNVISISLAKELLAGLGLEEEINADAISELVPDAPPLTLPVPGPEGSGGGKPLNQEEIEKLMASMNGGGSEPSPPPEAESGGSKQLSQEEIEKLMSGGAGATPPSAQPSVQPPAQPPVASQPTQGEAPAAAQPAPVPQGVPGQMPPYAVPGAEGMPFANGYMGYPPMYYPPYPYPYPPQPQEQPPDPKVISTQPLPMQQMNMTEKLGKEQVENLELIMEVPLQVTVEIGRTRRKVQDILEFSKGSLVVLDKLAGDQVDLFVNGKCIARGDVVVIEDNFGVRITEIVQKPGIEPLSAK